MGTSFLLHSGDLLYIMLDPVFASTLPFPRVLKIQPTSS